MHIEQFFSKFPCRLQQVHVLSSLLMNGTYLSTSICCAVFGIGGMWHMAYSLLGQALKEQAKPDLYKPLSMLQLN